MNSEQSLDLWQEISLPSWIGNNSENSDQNMFNRNSSKRESKNNMENDIQSEEYKQISFKRQSPVVQNHQHPELQQQAQSNIYNASSSSANAEYYQQAQKTNPLKTKLQRRCQNSRKYRQRKRQYVRSLQQQNRFLKSKIDSLNFQLTQMQRQINRLKHRDPQQTQTFHITREKCLKQLQQLLLLKNDNDDGVVVVTHQQLVQADGKLRRVLSFDNKQKVDYLNYFMSQLLENVINDRTFYFIDCLVNKIGVHRQSYQQELRRIDVEVIEILDIDEVKLKDTILENRRMHLAHQASRLKELWKKLYQVYLAILNQGMRLDRIVEPMKQRLMKYVKLENFLRVQLHFERNKYRSDIRYMRNSWFRELSQESTQQQKEQEKSYHHCNPSKRTKCNNNQ